MTVTGLRYRLLGVGGTLALTVLAVVVASHPAVLETIGFLPVLGELPRRPAGGQELVFEAATTAIVVLAATVALFKPRPWRLLDVAGEAARRVVVAVTALAAIGYFDYTYRLPRVTLLVAGGILVASLPIWFVVIRRRRPTDGTGRTVVIGDDPDAMAATLAATDRPILGYVSSPAVDRRDTHLSATPPYPDGGVAPDIEPLADLGCLGGLSRLGRVLVDNDVETAVLAFARPDRAEFFGALGTCRDHGVRTKVHRKHADSVLTNDLPAGDLVEVDLSPWDPQDRLFKRVFDVVVSTLGIVILAPVMVVIGAAIWATDGRPVLVTEERTAAFGDTVSVYKFRTPDDVGRTTAARRDSTEKTLAGKTLAGKTLTEKAAAGTDNAQYSADATPLGQRLARIIGEPKVAALPVLWSVLVGDMSLVGPRPERPERDGERAAITGKWRCRWFIAPGLTGLARVRGGPEADHREKLRIDMEYIRRQSLRFDLTIVLRRAGQSLSGAVRAVASRLSSA